MDLFTFLLCKKKGGGGVTYTLSADTVNKQIVLTPSKGDAQAITVPYATDASTVNGKDVPELENGKIPATYLPSYVDDILEYEDLAHFPVEGEVGKIYITRDTNLIYRWSGSMYAEINQSLALGETEATAYRGDRGKIAYNHSQSAHAPSNAEANQNAFSNITVGDTTIEADSKTDTFTLEAGSNITLTPDASTDKVTITATDTTYSDATTSTSGLMSGADKTKLNGIATGAEVNQNAFSNVKIGSDTIAADSKTDTLELEAGTNIELTSDTTNDKVTISGIPVTRTIRDASVASFSDGADAVMQSLKVDIKSVQDLHGYDSPWAGGAGKNKFNNTFESTTESGITYTVNSDGTIKTNGTSTAVKNIVLGNTTLNSGSYIINGCPSGGGANTYRLQVIKTADSSNLALDSGEGATFNLSEVTEVTVCLQIRAEQVILNNLMFYPMIRLASVQDATFAPYSNICPISGWTEEVVTVADDLQNPTVTHTTTIPFTDSQGNPVDVYGGSIECVSGALADDGGKKVFDGSENWRTNGNAGVYIFVSDIPNLDVNKGLLFDKYKFLNEAGEAPPNNCANFNAQKTAIQIRDSRAMTNDAFKTLLQTENLTMAYKKTTPTTFYTQPTSIKSLDGENNVFASTGALREVTYRTQAYSDLIAEKDLPDAISNIKTLKLDENQILIGDHYSGGNLDKIGLFMDNYYDENLDATYSTEVTPQEIYLTSQPVESVNQTAIITSDRAEYHTSLSNGTEVINTVSAIGMEVNVKENHSITHGIKIVSGDIRLLGSDTWDGTNISLKNALEAIQNNLYIANYNKTASLSSGSNTIALDMTGYTYNGSDIVNVYVDGLYKVNNTDYTITVNDSTEVASINYTAAAASTMAIQVIKPKIGFTALTDGNGDNVTDNSGNSIDI